MPYTVTPTAIPVVLILEPKIFGDDRGFFFESFNQLDFNLVTGLDVQFVQDNVDVVMQNTPKLCPSKFMAMLHLQDKV